MKHILLTGATGFLGSHLLKALIEQEYKVTIVKRSTSDTWRIAEQENLFSSFDVDIDSIEGVFEKNHFDVVVHAACNYGRGGGTVLDLIEANILFGVEIARLSVEYSVPQFINFDTFFSKYYKPELYMADYVLSKIQFLEWLKYYSSKLKVINLVCHHVYGENEGGGKFVYWLKENILENNKNIPLTSGDQKRDFVHVNDVVRFCIAVMRADLKLNFNSFEVGSGEVRSIREFVEVFHGKMKANGIGLEATLDFGAIVSNNEIMDVASDISESRNIGWSPSLTMEEGVEKLAFELSKGFKNDNNCNTNI